MSNFEFTFPEFVTTCEKRELILFFKKYFTAIHESEKYPEEEIAKRKKMIIDALRKNLEYRQIHMNKMNDCWQQIKNYNK